MVVMYPWVPLAGFWAGPGWGVGTRVEPREQQVRACVSDATDAAVADANACGASCSQREREREKSRGVVKKGPKLFQGFEVGMETLLEAAGAIETLATSRLVCTAVL